MEHLIMADIFNSPSLLQAASIAYYEGNVCLVTSKVATLGDPQGIDIQR